MCSSNLASSARGVSVFLAVACLAAKSFRVYLICWTGANPLKPEVFGFLDESFDVEAVRVSRFEISKFMDFTNSGSDITGK